MSKKSMSGPERLAAERRLSVERGLTFPALALGLPPTPVSSLHQMKIAPPSAPAPGPRVAPPRSPRGVRMMRRAPSPASLRIGIDDHLHRIKHGDRQLVPLLVDQYSELAAIRRRVLSAAFGADIGEVAPAKKTAGAVTRRIV